MNDFVFRCDAMAYRYETEIFRRLLGRKGKEKDMSRQTNGFAAELPKRPFGGIKSGVFGNDKSLRACLKSVVRVPAVFCGGAFVVLGLFVVLYDPLAARLEVAEAGRHDGDWASAETALLRRGRGSLPALRSKLNDQDHRVRLRCALTAALLGDRQGRRVLSRALRAWRSAATEELESSPPASFLDAPTPTHTQYARFGEELFPSIPAFSEEAAWAETLLLSYWRRYQAPRESELIPALIGSRSVARTRSLADDENEDMENEPGAFDETAFWGRLTQNRPNWVEGHAAFARALLRAGRPYEAKRAALRALRLEPDHFGACLAAARAYSNMGAVEESSLFFQRLLKTNPRLSAEPRIKALREAVEKVAAEKARLRRENRARSAKVASARDMSVVLCDFV